MSGGLSGRCNVDARPAVRVRPCGVRDTDPAHIRTQFLTRHPRAGRVRPQFDYGAVLGGDIAIRVEPRPDVAPIAVAAS